VNCGGFEKFEVRIKKEVKMEKKKDKPISLKSEYIKLKKFEFREADIKKVIEDLKRFQRNFTTKLIKLGKYKEEDEINRDVEKRRLLSRKERTYILDKILHLNYFKESFGSLSKKEEEKIIHSITRKIQAPQDFPMDSKKDRKRRLNKNK